MTGSKPLFLFGTLRHLPLLRIVSGADLAPRAAWLTDHRQAHAVHPVTGASQVFPRLTQAKGHSAQGLLIHPDPRAQARLDAYERLFDYTPHPHRIDADDGPVEALIYLPDPGTWLPGEDWSLRGWQDTHGPLTERVAAEVMELLETLPESAVRMRVGMLQAFHSSAMRAENTQPRAEQRRAARVGDVVVDAFRRPYSYFFSVQEMDMRFRRFDNSLSDTVTRAGFIMGDAVTVLPYDPRRDCVMLVEQFRFGPYARGDRNPWSLEPIAGRIDAAEEPADAARREALEEAGLSLQALEKVSEYYVSPGAVTEYLFSYVAVTDLTPAMEGVGGVETEAEDIRSHVISFDRAMALMASGEISNGPLIITLQWLAANRDRLRAD